MVIGEFQNNLSLILKVIGIAILCSILKSIQTNFSKSGISEIAFYVCYLLIVTLAITSFTNIVTLCTETVGKLSDFMNMAIPLLFAFITVTGKLATLSFLQPFLLGMIGFISFLMNQLVIPLIYIATVITIVTNISSFIKLDKLSDLLKKTSLWIVEFSMIVFVGILSLEGSLAASVDGLTSKIAKNVVSSTIPVVGKILGDTVDSVLGGIMVTKNALGFLGVLAILAITISPFIKSFISMMVFQIATAIIEPVADSRIFNCMNKMADSLKVLIGIMALVIFLFMIAVTFMIKISNTAMA